MCTITVCWINSRINTSCIVYVTGPYRAECSTNDVLLVTGISDAVESLLDLQEFVVVPLLTVYVALFVVVLLTLTNNRCCVRYTTI